MSSINLYQGELTYWRGKWAKDSNENDFVAKDDDNLEHFAEQFQLIPAKSTEQLVFILSKSIQEKNNLPYPIFIDWREVKAKAIGTIPDTSPRFEKLADSITS